MTTPAQATGHPTLDDVPVSGPTDPGIWSADCHFMQTVLPTPQNTPCVDCKGTTPMVALKLKPGLSGEWGVGVGAPGDSDIWTKMTPPQQAWIASTLSKLNDQIVKATGTTCPTWGPSITAAGGCFQAWFNSIYGPLKPPGIVMPLRTDGVFDQDTFWAVMKAISDHPADFKDPFPGAQTKTDMGSKKLSTGAMVGIAAGGAAVLGGIAYAVTRKGGRRKGRKASRRRR